MPENARKEVENHPLFVELTYYNRFYEKVKIPAGNCLRFFLRYNGLKALHKCQKKLLLLGGKIGKSCGHFVSIGGLFKKFLQRNIHGIAKQLQMANGNIRFTPLYPAQMGLGNTGPFCQTVLGQAALLS